MKNIQLLLVFALMFWNFTITAQQNRALPSDLKAMPGKATFDQNDIFAPNDLPASVNLPSGAVQFRGETESLIGETIYDLQTNYSTCNRMYNGGDGDLTTVWTMGFDVANGYPDRGTGYSAAANGVWGDVPDDRLEEDVRTGWPNYVRTESGSEFIVNHVFTASEYRMHTLRRASQADAWEEGDIPTNVPIGVLWPRAVGGSGETIHAIGIATPTGGLGGEIYQGIDAPILYYRSPDGGATWDVQDFIIPGLDSTHVKDLSFADSYAIDARGDVVTVAVFHQWNDVMVFKSLDNGDTWTRWRIFDFPIDRYQIDDGYTVDDIPPYDSTFAPNPVAIFTSDNSGAVVIDHNDMVHITYGQMFVQDTLTTDGSFFYFPCTSGLAYWNESFGEDSTQVIADVQDLNGDTILNVDCANTAFGVYFTSLTSFSSMGVDANNNIYVAYSALMEGDVFFNEEQTQNYRHIYVMASEDGGTTWHEPYDIVNEDLSSEPDLVNFVEAVFPHIAKNVDDKVHLVYQLDYAPGLAVRGDGDVAETNFIAYVGIDLAELGVMVGNTATVAPEQLAFELRPNPATNITQVSYELGDKADVTLAIYNLMGQEMSTVLQQKQLAGSYQVEVPVHNLAKGVYLMQINVDGRVATQKLVIQ